VPAPFPWPSAPQQDRAGGELRHLPQGPKGGSASFAGTGECVAADRSESSEINRAVERVSRFRSALSHDWWPSGR
jgi:hypothetical protein